MTLTLKAIPTTYRGTRFRSRLEADWAATFDSFGWHWEYEPVALEVGGHAYLPDFRLPSQKTWAEVKGPDDERLEKAIALAHELETQRWAADEWEMTRQQIVILRPAGPGDTCMWDNALYQHDMVIICCPECHHFGWMDYAGVWRCPRGCRNGGENKFWSLPGGDIFWPGELPFKRAPRGGVA